MGVRSVRVRHVESEECGVLECEGFGAWECEGTRWEYEVWECDGVGCGNAMVWGVEV